MPGTVKSELFPDAVREVQMWPVGEKQNFLWLSLDNGHFITVEDSVIGSPTASASRGVLSPVPVMVKVLFGTAVVAIIVRVVNPSFGIFIDIDVDFAKDNAVCDETELAEIESTAQEFWIIEILATPDVGAFADTIFVPEVPFIESVNEKIVSPW